MSVCGTPFEGGTPAMRKRAFTLIELLVVIAVIVLLMAILVPTLQRVKRQAKALVCQSNLRQSGVIWAAYTHDHDGYFPGGLRDEGYDPSEDDHPHDTAPWSWYWGTGGQYWHRHGAEGIRCCPMATKIAHPSGEPGQGDQVGGTFLAWGRIVPKGRFEWDTYGSYGINLWVYQPRYREIQWYPYFWGTCHVGGASDIPVELDNYWPSGFWFDFDGPPPCDAVPNPPVRHLMSWGHSSFCMNRHDGGINGLFMDWSVRKVGLKELWMFRWHPEFDTASEWTRAGGVQPEDWPKWMRRFKDY
jgi:prepilin-type N-terminal cleavage/methylation domain-containing protein/prepilin-type processing-associated H-X9-DG protein